MLARPVALPASDAHQYSEIRVLNKARVRLRLIFSDSSTRKPPIRQQGTPQPPEIISVLRSMCSFQQLMCFDRGSLYECFQESRKFEDDGSAESNSECRRVTAGRTGKRAVRLDLVYDFSLIQALTSTVNPCTCTSSTEFMMALLESQLPGLTLLSRGKVRDIYGTSSPDHLLFVASDRISAYDVILQNVCPNLIIS